MEFKKYNSIENTYKQKVLDLIDPKVKKEIWVVTDKLDGANFSFITNGFENKVAKRSGYADDYFFNCKSVIDKYSDKAKKTYKYLISEYFSNQLEYIQIYGELIGDGINNRVKYCKDREFFVYDIKYKLKDENSTYLKISDVIDICAEFDMYYVPSLFCSDFDTALKYCKNNEDRLSTISKILNNEYKDLENNIEEGYVLKPNKPFYFNNGERIILKHKNSKFKEVEKSKVNTKDNSLNFEQQAQLDFLLNFVTESRFYSVISKEGQLTDKDFGRLIKKYTKDVYKDAEVIKVDQQVSKLLSKYIVSLIRPLFLNVVG